MSLEVDHVIFCVRDLGAAAQWLQAEHGLQGVVGGRHPGHGTENRIVPLGTAYLELVGIVDAREASLSNYGRWVSHHAVDEPVPHALCLRTDDLEDVCQRFGLEASSMSRSRPDGVELKWRVAGLEHTIAGGMPFFIEWQVPQELHPGRTGSSQEAEPGGVEVWLEGDHDLLSAWVGDASGVHVEAGPPRVSRLSVRTPYRKLVFSGDGG